MPDGVLTAAMLDRMQAEITQLPPPEPMRFPDEAIVLLVDRQCRGWLRKMYRYAKLRMKWARRRKSHARRLKRWYANVR